MRIERQPCGLSQELRLYVEKQVCMLAKQHEEASEKLEPMQFMVSIQIIHHVVECNCLNTCESITESILQ